MTARSRSSRRSEERAPSQVSVPAREQSPERPTYSAIEAELKQTKELLAEAIKKQETAPPPAVGSLSAGLILPHVPRLKSLESQGTIKAWIAQIEQFCSHWSVPKEGHLRCALAGLEDEAARIWGGLVYLRAESITTLKEMGEVLLQYNRQKHSMYALWGLWAALKQNPGESSQKYCDRVRDLQAQESLPDHWAVAALIRGIREPLRNRFYDTLRTKDDRTLSLDEVARLFVRFELTQSFLQGQGGSVSSTTATTTKRGLEGAAPPLKKRSAMTSSTNCWICGAHHNWPNCPAKKDEGCPSCGGSCSGPRQCPSGWFLRNQRKAAAAAPKAKVANPEGSLRAGRRIPPPSARAIRVLDLTEVKPVSSRQSHVDLAEGSEPHCAPCDVLALLAGPGHGSETALGERSLEGLLAIGQLCRSQGAHGEVAFPPLLSLSDRDMLLPFECNGHRAIALVDTGASTSFVDPAFLQLVKIPICEEQRVLSVRLADGYMSAARGVAVMDVSVSTRWPLLRITVRPFRTGGYPLILGADWAKRLDLCIEWPGPSLCSKSASKWRPAVAAVAEVGESSLAERRMAALLVRFQPVFTPPGPEPALVPFQHVIRLEEGARPFRSPPYWMTAEQLGELKEEIGSYLEKGWVQPSQSPWGAPITYVPKKDNSRRLVFDYRRLNKVTLPDASPLPRIDDLLSTLARSTIYSKLDLKQGYNQIAMGEESIPLTAFVTPIPIKGANHFEWTVLPFGLMNAPPTFQRVMHHVLQGTEDFAAVYMDDILVHSASDEDHLAHVTKILELLRKSNLHASATKCEWCRAKIEFLGYELSHGKVSITVTHEEAIRR